VWAIWTVPYRTVSYSCYLASCTITVAIGIQMLVETKQKRSKHHKTTRKRRMWTYFSEVCSVIALCRPPTSCHRLRRARAVSHATKTDDRRGRRSVASLFPRSLNNSLFPPHRQSLLSPGICLYFMFFENPVVGAGLQSDRPTSPRGPHVYLSIYLFFYLLLSYQKGSAYHTQNILFSN